MGWNPNAYAVIGIYLTKDECFGPPVMEKAFDHNHGKDMKFDPQTGLKLWGEVRPCLFEQQDEGENNIHLIVMPDGLESWTDGYDGANHLFIGIGVEADENEWEQPVRADFKLGNKTVTDTIDRLKAFLKPIGLWEICKDRFGLYAILS